MFKEFDEWPAISLEPDPLRENREKEKDKQETPENNVNNQNNTTEQKMTRKSRPRIKEKEEKETKAGYCEMCNADYVDAALHRRSPHHLAFVRDHTNFLALDSLISSGADVTTFLDKATPINGERRSLRKMCNGDLDQSKMKRSKRSQSPDSTVNGSFSPKRNGGLDDDKRHTRCSKRTNEQTEDRQYYKVVSTKLRSSGAFQSKRKESPPNCNGAKPLVVKFRKVRRSELSVLSDEAEQFMFPKRASSTSSTSSDDSDEKIVTKRKTPPQPPPPPANERRRLARPVALKEESSEEDSWPEDKRRRKRRGGAVARRGRRTPGKPSPVVASQVEPEKEIPEPPPPEPTPQPEAEVTPTPLREPPVEKCMKWEDGKLKYTPAVEQLEFAFESVPRSEPWFETFKRQDQDKVLMKNVPQYFALYSKSPKLPYEIGQLPPLKPNCCPLSDLVKREEKPGPSRSYGTRGMKKQKIRKRTAAVVALESHPRKSPREHASTLAILGSAGLLNRRKNVDDTKSTASEDTVSDSHSNLKAETMVSETQEESERLQQFLSEVFEDAADYDMSDDAMDGDVTVTTLTNVPDVSSLVSECENCDIIRNEIKAAATRPRRKKRGKFKRTNKTGWPNKKRQMNKGSRGNSVESEKGCSSIDRSSVELPDDTIQGANSEDDTLSESEKEAKTLSTLTEKSVEDSQDSRTIAESLEESQDKCDSMDDDKPLKERKRERSPSSDSEERDLKKKKKALHELDWLQPIVRVARVDPSSMRRLRSAGRARGSRFR